MTEIETDSSFRIDVIQHDSRTRHYILPDTGVTTSQRIAEAQEMATEIFDNVSPQNRQYTTVYLTIKSKANEQ